MVTRKTRFFLAAVAVFCVLTGSDAHADVMGQAVTFTVNPKYDVAKRSSLGATLRYISQHAYFYVDDAFWNKQNAFQRNQIEQEISTLAQEFDLIIYPKETSIWGQEPNPGVDGDPRLTILFEELTEGSGGYYETINGYNKTEAPASNEREMVVISAYVSDSGFKKAFLAHEFQHLISFQQKELNLHVSEEVWLNELRSEYSVTLAGYSEPYQGSSLQRRVTAFLQSPADSLLEWPNATLDYASVAVFAEYLTGRYGLDVLTQTLQIPLSGLRSLDQYWSNHGLSDRFTQVFGDWMVANYLNDPADSRFGYVDPDLSSLRVSPSYRSFLSQGYPVNMTSAYSIKGWQPVWHEFYFSKPLDDDKAVKVAFTGESGNQFGLAVAVFYDDGTYKVRTDKVINGAFSVYVINPQSRDGTVLRRVTKVLTAMTHVPDQTFSLDSYPTRSLSSNISLIGPEQVQEELKTLTGKLIIGSEVIADGALIKRNNSETEMYVVTGEYKRYLRPDIIRLYGHLDPANVVPVEDSTFNMYKTANYVRNVNDKKVWVIWPDGTKHWLNMSAEYFTSSGRDWNAIFIINDLELAAYRTGVDITR